MPLLLQKKTKKKAFNAFYKILTSHKIMQETLAQSGIIAEFNFSPILTNNLIQQKLKMRQ